MDTEEKGTGTEGVMQLTKYQACEAACSGRSSDYLGGYIAAAFGNAFNPGREVAGMFLPYAVGSDRHGQYSDGFNAALEAKYG